MTEEEKQQKIAELKLQILTIENLQKANRQILKVLTEALNQLEENE